MPIPIRGARVNVVGTVVVFEAVKERGNRIPGLAYASSTAVYNASDPSPAPETGGTQPTTHYGVYKLANEGTARIFWDDEGVASIGIRPYIVYGPGRDQGMTSGPTLAMAAAARGEGFEVGYGGTAQYDYAPDVGRAFVLAARAAGEGAHVANFPGEPSTMQDVVAAIEAGAPEAAGKLTWTETALPFPESLESGLLERLVGSLPHTPLHDGVRRTIEHFHARALVQQRAENVSGDEEPALDEILRRLEVAILVLDRDHVVVSGSVQRGDEAIPAHLAEPR